ncbi:MAG: phosphoenolpyruvate kinase [Saprospiraceae bacterium]|nr:phosphoenolpyruvate kinase [Pyrinomonadaceae bacterium]
MSKTVLHDGDEGVLLIVKDIKRKRNKVVTKNGRSPVHVVYGGAHLFKAGTPEKLGRIALESLSIYAPNFVEFAGAMRLKGSETLPRFPNAVAALEKELAKKPEKVRTENFSAWFAWSIYNLTRQKLQTEPVEDYRIDFEDGYGFRTNDEEDAHAISAAEELAKSFESNAITRFSGFRIKSLGPETHERAGRTLHLFLDTFLAQTNNKLPTDLAVTLPKVSDKKEVRDLCRHLEKIEKKHGLGSNSIGIEIMIETPLAIVDRKGRLALKELVKAAKGRQLSAHFGAYDYTASLGISANHQSLHHDACNFARQMMLLSLSPLEIRLSDSVTTDLPLAMHKGEKLSQIQRDENRRAIHSSWLTHFQNVTQSMINGFYQSWDLHPNQLVARYAAVYSFFFEAKEAQALRLKGFIEKEAQAVVTGNTFDDAASAQGLVNFFRRGLDCGALNENEILESTSLTMEELSSGSFSQIAESRRKIGQY